MGGRLWGFMVEFWGSPGGGAGILGGLCVVGGLWKGVLGGGGWV